jgi:hypothetical protein
MPPGEAPGPFPRSVATAEPPIAEPGTLAAERQRAVGWRLVDVALVVAMTAPGDGVGYQPPSDRLALAFMEADLQIRRGHPASARRQA